jgi:hypothetical protein
VPAWRSKLFNFSETAYIETPNFFDGSVIVVGTAKAAFVGILLPSLTANETREAAIEIQDSARQLLNPDPREDLVIYVIMAAVVKADGSRRFANPAHAYSLIDATKTYWRDLTLLTIGCAYQVTEPPPLPFGIVVIEPKAGGLPDVYVTIRGERDRKYVYGLQYWHINT